jgi:hypothetical protein
MNVDLGPQHPLADLKPSAGRRPHCASSGHSPCAEKQTFRVPVGGAVPVVTILSDALADFVTQVARFANEEVCGGPTLLINAGAYRRA